MAKKNNYVMVGGINFSEQSYEYLLNRFKEAFSHSSLSIEQAFDELEQYTINLESTISKNAYDYYSLLSHSEKLKIRDVLHQSIVYYGSIYCIFKDKLSGDMKQVEKLYNEYFKSFEDYIYYFIKFDEKGNFDRSATFKNLNILFVNLMKKNTAYDVAYNMKKDNLNAFDYAITLDEVTIPDIIMINSLVNDSDDNKVDGFKTVNNDILSAPFIPTDKEYVPIEMQKLLADYKNSFGLEILNPFEENITNEERLKRNYNIFKREAIFHIRFERIHPFNDGNGRTGRIIMNSNLLRYHQAPVLITDVMSSEYKNLINVYDVEGLTKLLISSSSQQLTNWISLEKAGLQVKKSEVSPKNEKLAELELFSDKKENCKKKRKVF